MKFKDLKVGDYFKDGGTPTKTWWPNPRTLQKIEPDEHGRNTKFPSGSLGKTEDDWLVNLSEERNF